MTTQIIGIIAGILTAASLVPQLLKIYKEKTDGNTSWFMLIVLMAGLSAWIWYGLLKNDFPIIITNSFSLVINTWIMILQHHYKKIRKKKEK